MPYCKFNASAVSIAATAIAMLGSAIAQSNGKMDDIIRGVVKAQNETVFSADIKARVAETPFRTGETFKKGDILLRFDCEGQHAEAAAAHAAYKAAKSRYDSTTEMKNYDAAGQFDVNLAKAEMDQAAAQARAIRARTKHCDLKAPYHGKVAELAINAFETPAADQPLIKIVGSSDLELRLIVPSKWLVWLEPEAGFLFTIDETGETLEATVKRIGAEVDAVSRTVPIIARFEQPPANVLPGMSGSAKFSLPSG